MIKRKNILLYFLIIIGSVKKILAKIVELKLSFNGKEKNKQIYMFLKRFAPLVLEHKKEVEDSTLWKEGQLKMMEEVIPSRLSNNL